jgi:sugar/nucleoside kinase (ribokinase family)
MIDYLLIGHITADLVSSGRMPGGTVAYAAPIVHRFGHQVGILTSAAACEPFLTALQKVAEVVSRVAPETTTFENIYRDDGRHQYVHQTAAPLDEDYLPLGWRSAKFVHLAPLVSEVDPGLAAHFPDATVMLTPQGYMRHWGDDSHVQFQRWCDDDMLQHVDILVLSKQDIREEPDLEAEFISRVPHVCITDDRRGGIYYHERQAYPYEAHQVTEVDPTGAGDVFATALLASLPYCDHDMRKAVSVAASFGALAVTRRGTLVGLSDEDFQQALDQAILDNSDLDNS